MIYLRYDLHCKCNSKFSDPQDSLKDDRNSGEKKNANKSIALKGDRIKNSLKRKSFGTQMKCFADRTELTATKSSSQ